MKPLQLIINLDKNEESKKYGLVLEEENHRISFIKEKDTNNRKCLLYFSSEELKKLRDLLIKGIPINEIVIK